MECVVFLLHFQRHLTQMLWNSEAVMISLWRCRVCQAVMISLWRCRVCQRPLECTLCMDCCVHVGVYVLQTPEHNGEVMLLYFSIICDWACVMKRGMKFCSFQLKHKIGLKPIYIQRLRLRLQNRSDVALELFTKRFPSDVAVAVANVVCNSMRVFFARILHHLCEVPGGGVTVVALGVS